jgi:lysophospholipase L1-like esterase
MKLLKTLSVCLCAAAAAAGLCACGNDANNPPSKEEKVLMVGDSLFDLWRPDYHDDLEGAPDLTNVAVGGTTSYYWKKGVRLVANQKPTKIIICIGTNNIADLHQTGEEAAKGRDGIQSMLETFHEAVPDAYMYLLTVNLCGETVRWNAREEIQTCNALMREYCAKTDWVEIVETERAFYDDADYTQKPNAEYFVTDYLHFSPKGYEKLTGIVRAALGLD